MKNLSLVGFCLLLLSACYTPHGDYGGVYYKDYSGSGGIQGGPVMTQETVGTGISPWGGMYNYEEFSYGSPNN